MPDVGAGEVLVRVSRTALCGSDFKLWHKGARIHRRPRDLRRRRAAGPSHARQALRRLHPRALRPLRRLPARRHPDVPGSLQPDRLEPAGRLCRICAGAGELPAAGARRHRGQPRAAAARHDRHVGARRALRRAASCRRRTPGPCWSRAPDRSGSASCWRCRRSATTTSTSPIPTRRGCRSRNPSARKPHPVGDASQALRADRRMLRRACGAQSRHRGGAAARRAGPGRRERRALDHRRRARCSGARIST